MKRLVPGAGTRRHNMPSTLSLAAGSCIRKKVITEIIDDAKLLDSIALMPKTAKDLTQSM